MSSFNKVMLMGNLTRDPEVRYTPNGAAITNFSLAINRKFKDQNEQMREETTFVELTAFGRRGENIRTYCSKGSPLFVEGYLRFEQWTDKNTGNNRSKLSVVVDNFQFLSSGSSNNQNADQYQQPAPPAQPQQPVPPAQQSTAYRPPSENGQAMPSTMPR